MFTLEIAAVLLILAVALVLFVTEKLRMDVVALLVLTALGLSGLVTPEQALSGFSNQGVVTVWAMFILSAGLSATGVADLIGRQVLKLAGTTEPRIIISIMLCTGALSAFMSNIGVAALMLPVVMDIARKTKTPPSRLLMPMAYASLLGGLTTLIGTPPNLVASTALEEAGHRPLTLFEFTPIGVPALITGTLFIAFIGRKWLPGKLPEGFGEDQDHPFQYAHPNDDQPFQLNVTKGSPFIGISIAETHIGPILGVRVEVIKRATEEIMVQGSTIIQEGDGLLVNGKVENFEAFQKWKAFEMASGAEIAQLLALQKLVLVSAEVSEDSKFKGFTVKESDFRRRFDAHILSIRNEAGIKRGNMSDHHFETGDKLQIETKKSNLHLIEDSPEFQSINLIAEESIADIYPDTDALLEMSIPENSHITGLKLKETGIAEDLHLRVLGIARKSGSILFPAGDETILIGDKLLIHGNRKNIAIIKGLQSLEIEDTVAVAMPSMQSNFAKCETTLAPQSTLVGKTLREINFRNQFGVQIDSIWRQGKSFRSHLRNMSLEFGDALIISGPKENIDKLGKNRDFLILTQTSQEHTAPSKYKALLAGSIMLMVITIVILANIPIALAAVAGSAIMIVTKCLSIDDAYRAIEWKSIFLIACMIPLGVAMNETGAAKWIAQGIAGVAKPFGPWGLVIGLYIMTALATTIVPTAALIMIMASIGIDACASFDIPPEMIVLAICIAASASFTSPISHPSNVLVMGPGGYRFIDYIKLGLVLAIVVMLTVVPIIWLRHVISS